MGLLLEIYLIIKIRFTKLSDAMKAANEKLAKTEVLILTEFYGKVILRM